MADGIPFESRVAAALVRVGLPAAVAREEANRFSDWAALEAVRLAANFASEEVDRVLYTDRQLQCVELRRRGRTSKQTAALLGVADGTIRFHLSCADRRLAALREDQTKSNTPAVASAEVDRPTLAR